MSLTSFNRRYDVEAIEMMISKLCLLGIMMLGVRCCFLFFLIIIILNLSFSPSG